MTVQLPAAINADGALVWAARTRLRGAYLCPDPECSGAVDLVRGETGRAPHFRHRSEEGQAGNIGGCGESFEHRLAKAAAGLMLETRGKALRVQVGAETLPLSAALGEEITSTALEFKIGSRRADVVGLDAYGKVLLVVEVLKSHQVGEDKARDLDAFGALWLEVRAKDVKVEPWKATQWGPRLQEAAAAQVLNRRLEEMAALERGRVKRAAKEALEAKLKARNRAAWALEQEAKAQERAAAQAFESERSRVELEEFYKRYNEQAAKFRREEADRVLARIAEAIAEEHRVLTEATAVARCALVELLEDGERYFEVEYGTPTSSWTASAVHGSDVVETEAGASLVDEDGTVLVAFGFGRGPSLDAPLWFRLDPAKPWKWHAWPALTWANTGL